MKHAFLGALAVVGLAGCSQTPTPRPADTPPPAPVGQPMFDQQSLQRGVQKVLAEKYSAMVDSVTCPAGQPVVVGSSFDCQITARSVRQTVKITVRTEDGQYEISRPQ